MKITLKKLIRGIIPYGIIRLREKSGFKGSEVVEQGGGGYSPRNSPFPPPPNVIPENMLNEYTSNGKIKVLYSFYDNRILDNEKLHNTRETYDSIFHKLQEGTFQYYGEEGKAILQALNNYPIEGKDVLIWGLAGCNCEAISIWKGANRVYVVDYNKPICDNEKIEVLDHKEITEKEITSDFAISYSSYEHDGLGRYGDPLSPNGDFRAMREAHKFLNDNGILFLGIPLGEDCIVWNAHRIYGKNRLPLLLKGWQLLDVFDITPPKDSPEYPFDLPLGEYIQNVMVLRKIKDEFPDDEFLLGKNAKSDTRNMVYERINKIIYEFKKNN